MDEKFEFAVTGSARPAGIVSAQAGASRPEALRPHGHDGLRSDTQPHVFDALAESVQELGFNRRDSEADGEARGGRFENAPLHTSLFFSASLR